MTRNSDLYLNFELFVTAYCGWSTTVPRFQFLFTFRSWHHLEDVLYQRFLPTAVMLLICIYSSYFSSRPSSYNKKTRYFYSSDILNPFTFARE